MQARRALLAGDVDRRELATPESPSRTPVDALAGQNIEQGNFLGQTQGGVQKRRARRRWRCAAVWCAARMRRVAAFPSAKDPVIAANRCTPGKTGSNVFSK